MTERSNDPAGQSGGPEGYRAGVDDIVIVPLVVVAFAIWRILRGIFFIVIDIIDFLFPILLQIMRFPLFTLRIIGDGLAALLKFIIRLLPVGDRRAAWREAVSQYWAWLRQKFSYTAFEEWLHHAFENGMAWVFKNCRTMSPRTALLVIVGAVLWLPISFTIATVMHAMLIAKALSLPAWMQLLHPVATVIAKTKLLVLPVYPAAWPQAKQHPAMQALIRFWKYLADHYLPRKAGHRYRQTEAVAARAADVAGHTAAATGLSRVGGAILAAVNGTAAWLRDTAWALMARIVALLSRFPIFGGIVQRYTEHYDEANREPAVRFSHKLRGFFERWSVKFTAEYYVEKERQDAAKGAASA